ncbi:ARHGAP11 [Lepeophtheirus salmonis]|uniref:ARHGAP11 n=1 Tax=Lepeophtheirus salmonis TaxID=72036 RepID=A0A7R8CIE0_LEPSM|nr:ARHGAP11 [Lepeophtheirus salmonis]CAF2831400.1 ARHGAP11 [Lepeophtheirus salmonis]
MESIRALWYRASVSEEESLQTDFFNSLSNGKEKRSLRVSLDVLFEIWQKTRVDLDAKEGLSVSVPEFLPGVVNFIRTDLEREGIFRLSGSESRQRALRERLQTKESISDWCSENMSVIDAAALLKHWLRELPDPLVPDVYQDVMMRCCSLSSEVDHALTLSTCLLPDNSSSTMSYLFRFFLDVTLKSEFNKMDVRNLAIVLAPSIFPLVSKKGGSLESTKNILNLKTQIVEKLILNAKKICMVEGALAEDYSCTILKIAPNFTSQSEDNLDNENMDSNTAGPSERRSRKKKKKHRRSGSLSRVITAFKGIISRSATPANRESAHPDPVQTPDSFFYSPSLSKNKRKAILAKDSDEISKMETPLTPKVRGKSFSVKRFKKKKTLSKTKSNESTTLVNFSPLRSRISLMSRTPETPDVVSTIKADRDLSDYEEKSIYELLVLLNSKRIMKNVVVPFRKVPMTDRITKKEMLISLPIPNLDSSTRSLNNSLRRGQPNSLNTGLAKPSPIKVEAPGLKPRIKMSFCKPPPPAEKSQSTVKVKKQDSLADLKKDLNEESTNNVKDIINKMKSIEVNSGLSPVTRSQLRRQSSAFEFARPEVSSQSEGGGGRGDTIRSSLARKNSSVKDLVRRIERIKVPSFMLITEGIGGSSNTAPVHCLNSTEEQQDQFEGCKRSSIIRIRNENRGKVSKSVETFTQPHSNRRVSARMGVSTTPSPFVTKRRQQTGIRTTTGAVKRHVPKNTDTNVSITNHGNKQTSNGKKSENGKPRGKNRNRKNGRHLTIGYLGEPVGNRSPLKERVNVITVQRSKSAQNPIRNETSKKKKKRQLQYPSSENIPVQRSHSCKKSELPNVPMTLKHTLYDNPFS